jgi:hypothetical protein
MQVDRYDPSPCCSTTYHCVAIRSKGIASRSAIGRLQPNSPVPNILSKFMALAEWKQVPEGQAPVRQGDLGDAM